ncbi:hypothetical protein CKAH01_13348 [Colletotrichum kahawae]|uniref:DUF6604 domain-containing protein n=1 Tax=Colletotrichum kahawae TaxID=34407 RepID=A0AAD9YRR0_COLKA|nr:hypothetical protein CKAH01_13348 [Colletotrichum kahawae]
MEATLDMSTVHILLKIYKSSTNCFLRWLWCAYHQVDPCAAGVKPFRTTRMIIKVSRTVYDASQPVPSSVLGALRDAIRFRSMVAQLYENSGRGDSGHRGFVKRLEQTLAILVPLETQDVSFHDYLGRQEDAGPRGLLEQQANKFASLMEGLNISPPASPPRASNTAAPAAPTSSSPNRPGPETEPKKPEEFILEDDDMGVAHDAARFLVDIHQFHDHLEQTWKAAGEDKIPLLVAAFQSNCVAYFELLESTKASSTTMGETWGRATGPLKFTGKPRSAVYACRYWAVIRTTLHLYNALRTKGFDEFQIPQVPMLEELSNIFLQEVFLGTVPKHRFLTSFRMAVYNSHWIKQSGTSQYELGIDLLTTSSGAVYWGLCEQHYANHRANGEFLCKTYKNEKPVEICSCRRCDVRRAGQVQANLQKLKQACDLFGQDSWCEYAGKSLEAVLAEVQGPAPIARVNFLKLFGYCEPLLNSFGRLAVPEVQNKYKEQGVWKGWMCNGLSISRFAVEDLLEILDALPGNTKRERDDLAREPLFKHAVRVFKALEKPDATLQDFLWNI